MYKIYQVEMNETLSSIADKLNTTVDNLKKINGIIGDVSLIPGTFLIIPYVDDRYITYIVKQGDNIMSISTSYNVDPKLLLEINGLSDEEYIYPNQEILIPNKNYNYYLTKKGDTVVSVAQALNKNIDDLLNINDTLYLEEGQMIIYK